MSFVAYFALLHALIVSGAAPLVCLAMVVAPSVVGVLLLVLAPDRAPATPVRFRPLRVALAIAFVVAVVAFGWAYGDWLAGHVEPVLYAENVAFLLWLSALFAITLRRGGEALITRLARVVRRGDMPPQVVRYTRAATAAWAIFFVVAASISTLLFATQSRTTWSMFANLLIWPMIAIMFLLEYAVRLHVLRDVAHAPMMTGLRAFRQRGRADPLDASGKSP